MSENNIPYLDDDFQLGPDGLPKDKNTWDLSCIDKPKDCEVLNTIQKIRNYYNGYHNINGRPLTKKDFNDFIDSLEKKL